jgi:broad-specificity NMP kinase
MLHVVTGAPGAGKSAAVAALLRRDTGYLVFDVDWLADAASVLANRSIYDDASTWPPCRIVAWLHAVAAERGRS